MNQQPIGVFDSGIGGLTVVAALRRLLPAESIFYIGDTARVPYGGKSRQTVERYSREISDLLLADHAKMIVVACNTASALAMPSLQKSVFVPVVGVVEPGARAAIVATRNGRIGVIGTRATVRSRAYENAIHTLQSDAVVLAQECPMLVPLIEEGWLEDPLTDQVIARYLETLLRQNIDTLVLGCTHYPLLQKAIARVAGNAVTLVDSARNCAETVRDLLLEKTMQAASEHTGSLQVALTDPAERFLRIAGEVLYLEVGEVELLSVQG